MGFDIVSTLAPKQGRLDAVLCPMKLYRIRSPAGPPSTPGQTTALVMSEALNGASELTELTAPM